MTRVEDATNEQLDVALAEKVMGWSRGPGGVCWFTKNNKEVKNWFQTCAYVRTEYWWQPATNIAAAFQVLLKIHEDHAVELRGLPDGRWACVYRDGAWYIHYADTAPRAICIAALKACGVEEV